MKNFFRIAAAALAIGGLTFDAYAQQVQPLQSTPIPNPQVIGKIGVTKLAGQTQPVVSACGTNTLSVGATDASGTIIISAGTPTSCTLTFAAAYQITPVCLWATSAGTNLTTVVTSTTASTVTIAAGANATLGYVCFGQGL